jgi:glycosyltransferase involved in cell wall biosynthesis
VPAGDAGALARALVEATASGAGELARRGAAGLSRAADFDPKRIGQQWSDLIDDKLGRLPRPDGQRHIALFLQSFRGGGAERSLLAMAGLLAEHGDRVDLIVTQATGPLAGEVPTGVRVVDLDAGRAARALVGLAGYLRAERPDVLVSTLDHANVIALLAARLARRGTPVVARVANTTSVLDATYRSPKQRLSFAIAKRLYPRAGALLAPSPFVARDLAAWAEVPHERVQVAPNPVITDELWRGAAETPGHPWFAPGEPPVVLAVGRLTPHKGHDTLIEAFARVRRRLDARLLILGEGADRDRLVGLATAAGLRVGRDGDVELAGFDANPFRYMRACAAFAHASAHEGLPGAIIQALACGAQVVATDCPGGTREVLGDGRWGRLVPMGDVDGFAAALEEALDAWIGGAQHPAPEEAWAPYTTTTAFDAYDRVLTKVIEERR